MSKAAGGAGAAVVGVEYFTARTEPVLAARDIRQTLDHVLVASEVLPVEPLVLIICDYLQVLWLPVRIKKLDGNKIAARLDCTCERRSLPFIH